ncbi:MAG TPA: hypothetical protein DDZ51_19010 [Planctomycetaceae bacterium]|nr:hypothetical protein [Planctomycetaceae bacterium]
MKDLYRKLSVPSTSSDAQIRAALTDKRSKLSAEDANDIECVLLDNLRRKKYDHVHRTVQCIVDLRSQVRIKETSGQERANVQGFISATQRQGTTRHKEEGLGSVGCLVIAVIGACLWLGSSIVIEWFDRSLVIEKQKKPEVPNIRIAPDDTPFRNSPSPTHAFPPKPEIELGRLALPETGVIQQYENRESAAPLEIRTRVGSGNYYIKISRIIGSRLVLSKTAFIRDGETLNTTMPVGDFEIRYAVGKNWYGTERFFGKSTSYAKADDVFSFRETLQGYSGFTVELYRQVNGNLETEPLSADEF